MEENESKQEIIELKKTFAQNLSFFRKKLNISQKELAERLNSSNKNISKWERAETIPDILVLKKLAVIFNVSVDTLISPLTQTNKTAIETKTATPLKYKICILFFVNAIILLLTCVLFFILKQTQITGFDLNLVFVYMLPFLDLTVFIFICIVFKRVDPISLSVLGWLIALCFYLTFRKYSSIVYIFLVAFAYQIIAPLFAALVNSRKIIKFNKLLISKFKRQDSVGRSGAGEKIAESSDTENL